jgi:hypothetical protein
MVDCTASVVKNRWPNAFRLASKPLLEVLPDESELRTDFDARNFRMPIQRSFRHFEKRCGFFDGQDGHRTSVRRSSDRT